MNDQAKDYVAGAVAIESEEQSGRPILGVIAYNVPKINVDNDRGIHMVISVTMHEVTHALGFSNDYFEKFIDEKGHLMKNTVVKFKVGNG